MKIKKCEVVKDDNDKYMISANGKPTIALTFDEHPIEAEGKIIIGQRDDVLLVMDEEGNIVAEASGISTVSIKVKLD